MSPLAERIQAGVTVPFRRSRDLVQRESEDTRRDLTGIDRLKALYGVVISSAVGLLEQHPQTTAMILQERAGPSVFREFGVLADLGKRMAYLDRGYRAANGTQLRLLEHMGEGSYGVIHLSSREDPRRHDHGVSHTRRAKELQTMCALMLPDLPTQDSRFIDALTLFPKNHDAYQLDVVEWNAHEIDKTKHLKSKESHDELGGLMLLAQLHNYARERHISLPRARERIAIAAIVTMVHSQPQEAITRLSGVQKAFFRDSQGKVVLKPDAEVLKMYTDHTLDLTSLSPSQYFMICKARAPKKSFPQVDGSSQNFFLHPAFQKAFLQELEEIAADTTPFFTDFSQRERNSLIKIAAPALFGDLLDMGYPTTESLVRKINVEIARSRPFFYSESSGSRESKVQNILTRIFGSDGNVLKSDYERTMWEQVSVALMLSDKRFENGPLMTDMLKQYVLFGILDTQRIFRRAQFTDTFLEYIDKNYQQRIRALGRKALKRIQVPKKKLQEVMEQSQSIEDYDALSGYFLGVLTEHNVAEHVGIHKRLEERLIALRVEKEGAEEIIREKLTKRRTQKDTGKVFSAVTDALYYRVGMEVLGVTMQELDDMKKIFKRMKKDKKQFQFPDSPTYDHIGSPQDATVLVRPDNVTHPSRLSFIG